jgi:branched-chain amino acid transport system substrate-binding protein
MMHRKRALLAATVAGAALLTACGGPQSSSQNGVSGAKIVIGVLADQTGAYSALDGQKGITAAKMAVDDFKKSHSNDPLAKDIELVTADSQNNPSVMNSVAQRMYTQQGVDMIVDAPNSAGLLAVSTLAQQYDKVAIGVPSGSATFVGKDCSPNTYLWAYTSTVLGNVVSDYLMNQGKKSWYILYPDYVYGRDYASTTKANIEQHGGKVVGTAGAPFPNNDFSSYMLKIANITPAPDVVLMIQSGTDLTNAMKAYHQFGLDGRSTSIALASTPITDVESIGPNILQGSVQATPWYWNEDSQARQWADRFLQQAGARPTFMNAGVYSATWQYLDAVLRAKSDSARAVNKALANYTFNDVFARNATVRAADHSVTKDMVLTKTKAPADIKENEDVFQIIGKVPAATAWPAPDPACRMTGG